MHNKRWLGFQWVYDTRQTGVGSCGTLRNKESSYTQANKPDTPEGPVLSVSTHWDKETLQVGLCTSWNSISAAYQIKA